MSKTVPYVRGQFSRIYGSKVRKPKSLKVNTDSSQKEWIQKGNPANHQPLLPQKKGK